MSVVYEQLSYNIILMQAQAPTPYGQHGTVIRKQSSYTINGEQLHRSVQCSDTILSKFGGYTQALKAIKIEEFQILRKQLDKPLGFIKSFFSKIINVKAEHQFIILHTQQFLATVDFYIENRIVIRIGEKNFVLDYEKSEARKNSQVVKEQNGLMWRRIIKKNEQLTLGSVIQLLLTIEVANFSQISNSGSHFSQKIFHAIQDKLIKPK